MAFLMGKSLIQIVHFHKIFTTAIPNRRALESPKERGWGKGCGDICLDKCTCITTWKGGGEWGYHRGWRVSYIGYFLVNTYMYSVNHRDL